MKSDVEKLSPTRVKLSIDVPFNELKPHIDGAYKTLAEKISIPGFRKGKVPAAMIDQRVGRGAVLDEAINAALPTFYSQAAKDNDVLVIGRPNVEITEEKKKTVIKNYGIEKWQSMIDHLNDPEKIMWTYAHILPNFLLNAVESPKLVEV